MGMRKDPVMGLLPRAAVASVVVHLAVLAALLRTKAPPPPQRVPPVEVELRFRAPEARRVVPQQVAPAKRSAPRRGVRSAPSATASPALTPPSIPLAVTDDAAPTGSFGPVSGPPSSGEAGDGSPDGGDSTVSSPASLPPPTEPRLLSLPRVDYPPRALMDEVEGVVRLDVHLSADGRVISIDVLESPGPDLTAAARAAILGARFQPATRDGQPVESRFPYRYRFELR
jgi:periplasmic protein TonB